MKASNLTYLLREAALILLFAYVLLLGGGFPALVDFRLHLFSTVIAALVLGGWLLVRMLGRQRLPVSGLEWALLFFVASQMVAAVFSEDLRRSLPSVVMWLAYAAIFYFALDLLRRGWPGELMEKCLLLVGALVQGFALFELGTLFTEWSRFAPGLEYAPPFQQRISGVLGDPNLLAAFTNLLIPLAAARALASTRVTRWVWLVFALAGVVVVYFTDSRGGLIGLGAGILALAVFWVASVSKPARQRALAAWDFFWARKLVLALIAAVVLVGVALVAWRFVSFEGDTTHAPALEARDVYWQAAMNAVGEDPLTGAGPGMYPVQLMAIWSTPPARPYLHAHSALFQVAAESGVLGLAALGYLIFAVGRRAAAARRGLDYAASARWAGALAALVGLTLHSLVDDFFAFPAYAATAMVLLAFATVGPKAPRVKNAPSFAWLALPGIAALIFTVYALRGYWHADQAVQLSRADDWQAAAAEMSLAADADGAFGFYWLQSGYASGRLGVSDQAVAAYGRGIDIEPVYGLSYANLAALHFANGIIDTAMDQMRIATSLAPESWLFWLNRGVYEEAAGEEEAALSYATALKFEPELACAAFWQSSSVRAAALAAFTPAPPADDRALALTYVAEARELIAARELDAADDLLAEAYALNDQEVRVYVALGEVALARGDLQLAEGYAQAALWVQAVSNEYKIEAVLLLAEVAAEQDDHATALQRYEAAYTGIMSDTSYGWGAAGWSPYAWFVFQRAAFAEDLLPGFVRADIPIEIAERLLPLAEMYDQAGQTDEAAAVREQLAPHLP